MALAPLLDFCLGRECRADLFCAWKMADERMVIDKPAEACPHCFGTRWIWLRQYSQCWSLPPADHRYRCLTNVHA